MDPVHTILLAWVGECQVVLSASGPWLLKSPPHTDTLKLRLHVSVIRRPSYVENIVPAKIKLGCLPRPWLHVAVQSIKTQLTDTYAKKTLENT